MKKTCPLCGDECIFRYKMTKYNIYQCVHCHTGLSDPLPATEELQSFYSGFIPNLNKKNIIRNIENARRFFDKMEINSRQQKLSLLDIGGGGGLFSYAFEHYGYGESTYIDLDPISCKFVKNELGISNVINGDASRFYKHSNKKFDVIYSRHLLEHLLAPLEFIRNVMKCLAPEGLCIHQFPNGDSWEYLPYGKMIAPRFKNIYQSSKIPKWKLAGKILSGQMLHGIDPPRHLWAFTAKGIKIFAKENGFSIKIFSAHLGELPFSPGYCSPKSRKDQFLHFLGQQCFARKAGGTHLIAIFS